MKAVPTYDGCPSYEAAYRAHTAYCFLCKFSPDHHAFINRLDWNALNELMKNLRAENPNNPMRACKLVGGAHKASFKQCYTAAVIDPNGDKYEEAEKTEFITLLQLEWTPESIYYHYFLIPRTPQDTADSLRQVLSGQILRVAYHELLSVDGQRKDAPPALDMTSVSKIAKLLDMAVKVAKVSK